MVLLILDEWCRRREVDVHGSIISENQEHVCKARTLRKTACTSAKMRNTLKMIVSSDSYTPIFCAVEASGDSTKGLGPFRHTLFAGCS